MLRLANRDKGQAFPIYAWMVAGLLFLALAFFAVGQAAAKRNGAQGAADAAALAAAQEARDTLGPGWHLGLLDRDGWEAMLDGKAFSAAQSCAAAEDFAAANSAQVVAGGCHVATPRFHVAVQTTSAVGNSVVPGTENIHAKASATAVIEPRCEIGSWTDPPPDSDSDRPSGPFEITCKGRPVRIDPSDLDPWRTLAKVLFDVRLAD
ncbi:pilus assembly protein TadG-related protein [Streptomyces sp. NPDC101118]|uniref:pilus assembly protein TadG-related protein n=1 Tax=Streptomyces sp. NPDC101118 TaxID=3366109 RepID=UPI00381F2402